MDWSPVRQERVPGAVLSQPEVVLRNRAWKADKDGED